MRFALCAVATAVLQVGTVTALPVTTTEAPNVFGGDKIYKGTLFGVPSSVVPEHGQKISAAAPSKGGFEVRACLCTSLRVVLVSDIQMHMYNHGNLCSNANMLRIWLRARRIALDNVHTDMTRIASAHSAHLKRANQGIIALLVGGETIAVHSIMFLLFILVFTLSGFPFLMFATPVFRFAPSCHLPTSYQCINGTVTMDSSVHFSW